MTLRLFWRGRVALAVGLVASCGLPGLAAVAPPPPNVLQSLRAPTAALPTRNTNQRVRPAYTLVDVGNPGVNGFYQWGPPMGLNNTGQMTGYANSPYGLGPVSPSTRCIVHTGKKFVDVTPPLDTQCIPSSGISDMKSGAFKTVGQLSDVMAPGSYQAFAAVVKGTTATTTVFENYQHSKLYAMNKHGVAVAYSDYSPPPPGFFTSTPPFVYTGKATLALLQPQCVTNQATCLKVSSRQLWGDVREINASNTVYGGDASGQPVEYTYGKPSSGVVLTNFFPPGCCYDTAGIDDKGNVYNSYYPTSQRLHAYQYVLKTAKINDLGQQYGAACDYHVLAVNGPGEVLGFAFCDAQHQYYWTWSSASGMVDTGIDSSKYSAQWLNDHGQISVAIFTNNQNGPDWGILSPPGSLHKEVR